jgi:hypothetical protein
MKTTSKGVGMNEAQRMTAALHHAHRSLIRLEQYLGCSYESGLGHSGCYEEFLQLAAEFERLESRFEHGS